MISHPSPRLQPIAPYITRWLFVGIGISLGGCASTALSTNSGSEKLQVVTTSAPITDFTKVIACDYLGDRLHQRAQVTQLSPANIDLHDDRPKLADVQQLAKADVLVKDGREMEGFLNNLVAKAKNTNLKTIDSSQGVQTIVTETIANDDLNLKAGKHDPREFNSYIWLDPKRAMLQVEKIRDGLIAADPNGKEVYTNNAAAYIQSVQEGWSNSENAPSLLYGLDIVAELEFDVRLVAVAALAHIRRDTGRFCRSFAGDALSCSNRVNP